MIIRLYDNEEYQWILIRINKNNLNRFKEILRLYQTEDYDCYNFEGFLLLLKDNKIKFETISPNVDVFF